MENFGDDKTAVGSDTAQQVESTIDPAIFDWSTVAEERSKVQDKPPPKDLTAAQLQAMQALTSFAPPEDLESVSGVKGFCKGVVHGSFEMPYNGVAQLANEPAEAILGLQIPQLDITGLNDKEMPTVAAEVGTVIGAVAPLFLANKVAGKLMGKSMSSVKTAEILGTATVQETVVGSAAQGFVAGGIYGGVFTPVPEGQDMMKTRLANSAKGAIDFAVFNAAGEVGRVGLSRAGVLGSVTTKEFLMQELPAATATGAFTASVAGAINTNVDTLIDHQRLATAKETVHGTASYALLGGAFSAVHQTQMRFVKPAQVTPEQLKQIEFARRTDGQNKDWVPMYQKLFPAAERQSEQVLLERLAGKPSVGGSPSEWMLHGTYAPNGKLLSASLNEAYPPRLEVPGEKGFILGAYSFTHPQLQSAGIGGYHLKEGVIPAIRKEFASKGFIGRVTEIEATEGMAYNSQPQRRARFYQDRVGLEALDKQKCPYELPLYQPDDVRLSGRYINQSEIPEYARSKGNDLGDGPVPAEILWTSFDNQPVTGEVARGVYARLAHWGYGVRPEDPYMQTRLGMVQDSPNLRTSMKLEPTPPEYTPTEQVVNAITGSSAYRAVTSTLDGEGLAAGLVGQSYSDK